MAAVALGLGGAFWGRGVGAQVAGSGKVPSGPSVDSLGGPAPLEPDPLLTPGATLPVTIQDICVPGYSRKVRRVPLQVKRGAYARYGISRYVPGEYEVDHLISLELGGSNSIRNLWPESFATTPWNAHVKDALENRLHREVCAGQLALVTAQHDIATDWIAAYQRYFHRSLPPSRHRVAAIG